MAQQHHHENLSQHTSVYLQDRNRDPGYWSTTRMLLECALCMTAANQKLLEQDPYAGGCPGGVLSPSAAFGLTLHERLKSAGYELTVEDGASVS